MADDDYQAMKQQLLRLLAKHGGKPADLMPLLRTMRSVWPSCTMDDVGRVIEESEGAVRIEKVPTFKFQLMMVL